jgi:serine/threonine protein kinase/WD40 repeat protein
VLPSGTKLGPYEIISAIGAGGMGEVYRAHDTRLGRDVAIKVLPESLAGDPERLRRFEQEARAVAALNHPSILSIHDFGSQGGPLYLVSELLEGETLREQLSAGALPRRKVIEYSVQIAEGLAAAHDKGIVHRDLKPENIFITRDGRIKILDFGLAKLANKGPAMDGDATRTAMDSGTEAGVVMGTVGYMSPEQVRGEPVDHRSDIFSFGAILYEMLSGKRAFRRDTALETMTAILKEDPPELTDSALNVSPGLDRLVHRCLEKQPMQRFQSASDVAFAVDAISGASLALPPKTAPQPASRGRRALFAFAAALVVAALAGAYALASYFLRPQFPKYSQITFRRGHIQNARFGDDGDTIIYSAEWDGNPDEVFFGRSDSSEARPLGLKDTTLAAVSSAGELAVLLGCEQRNIFASCTGTLARVSMAGGSPRQVAEHVTGADWSPDGKLLAAVRAIPGHHATLEAPIGRILFQSTGYISAPRFSRSGKWIALVDHPFFDDDRGYIVVVDLSGKEVARSSLWLGGIEGLAWSPEGKEVWFAGGRAGWIDCMAAMSLSGRDRILATFPGIVRLLDVSPQGKMLFGKESWRSQVSALLNGFPAERDFSLMDFSRALDVTPDGKQLLEGEDGLGGGDTFFTYLRPADGSPAVRLGTGAAGQLSADGKWADSASLSPVSLNILPLGPGENKTLELGTIVEIKGAGWFPSGKEVVFLGRARGGPLQYFAQPVDHGLARAISGPLADLNYVVCLSRDGLLLAAIGPDGKLTIYPVSGGAPRPLAGFTARDFPLGWSYDGTLLVGRSGGRVLNVSKVDVNSGRVMLWREFAPSDRAGLSFVGPRLVVTPDEKYYAYNYGRYLSDLFVAQGLQ